MAPAITPSCPKCGSDDTAWRSRKLRRIDCSACGRSSTLPKPPPPSKKGGAPSKFTPEVVNAIYGGIRLGLNLEDASTLAGVDRWTVWQWVQRGEAQEPPFLEFSNGLKKARATGKGKSLQVVASQTQWQAHAWLLERRFPEEFAIRSRIDQVAQKKTESHMKWLLEQLSDDARAEAIAVLGAIGAAPEGIEEAPGATENPPTGEASAA